jgi:group II intron reverse transcriptase/maturase
MAVRKIRSEITFGKKTEVIEADIVGCFDNIRHDILLNLVQRRVSDQRLLKLIRAWLRAGVLEDTEWQAPDGLGSPQGAVISPLLCNIYLHSFDMMFKLSKIPGTLVRFADDLVILLWSKGKQVLKKVKGMMARLGLQLHPDKTRITRAEDGFDFLGIHFRLRPITRPDAKVKQSCAVWPSNRSIKRVKQRVRDIIGRRYSLSLEEMIAELNPSLRGWANFHLSVQPNRSRMRKLNGFVCERLRIFLRRKYNDDGRGSWRVLGNLPARLGLYQFA